jgi:DNA-binding LacI/PurR family transcriptional regulator
MLDAIEAEMNSADYSMLLDSVYFDPSRFNLPTIMDANRVDGMLFMMGIVSEEHVARIKQTGIPTVLVGSRHKNLDYVDTDAEKGMYLATKYLLEQGHREIAFINGPDISQSSTRKMDGITKALREHKLAIQAEMRGQGAFNGETGYQEIKRIWESGARPTAIIGGADSIAIGAMRYFHEIGLSCPQDISIIGFEDGLLAEYAIPPLTTVRIHKSQMGALACNVLINRINNAHVNYVKIVKEPDLVIRQSVRALR